MPKAKFDKVAPSTHKEKLKFLLEKVLKGNSTEEMLEAYKGQKLDPKYIKRFEVYKKLYDTAPKAFAGVCKANGVKIPAPIEEYKSDEEHKSAAVVASSVLLAAIPMPVEEEDGLGVAGAINETPE